MTGWFLSWCNRSGLRCSAASSSPTRPWRSGPTARRARGGWLLAAGFAEQTAYRLKSGLCVRVAGAALHQLNVALYEAGETLGAQVHAHPTNAYHSETDDSFPIVTLLGGLSLVAPDFCRRGLLTDGTAAYRLTTAGWTRVTAAIVDVT